MQSKLGSKRGRHETVRQGSVLGGEQTGKGKRDKEHVGVGAPGAQGWGQRESLAMLPHQK